MLKQQVGQISEYSAEIETYMWVVYAQNWCL